MNAISNIRHIRTWPLFHRALLLDLVASCATALLLIAGADLLAPAFALPADLLRTAGLVLLPFLLLLAWVLRQARPHTVIAWAIIEINVCWSIASFYLLYEGPFQPTMSGIAFVSIQATAVLGLALLQFIGWRRLDGDTGYASAAQRA